MMDYPIPEDRNYFTAWHPVSAFSRQIRSIILNLNMLRNFFAPMEIEDSHEQHKGPARIVPSTA
jgi:hypothetical protein